MFFIPFCQVAVLGHIMINTQQRNISRTQFHLTGTKNMNDVRKRG